MADQYELMSSMANQSNAQVFKRKYHMRIPDTNGQAYPNAQINWNLSALTTNNAFLSCKQSSLEIPYIAHVTSSVAIGTLVQNTYMIALKKSVMDLVNGMSLTLNENAIINFCDLSNLATQFKILSTWSQDDITTKGDVINWAKNNSDSYAYDGAVSANGIGENNNVVTNLTFNPGNGIEQGLGTVQNSGFRRRANKTSYNVLGTEIAKYSSLANVQNSRKSFMHYESTTSMYYYIMVTIPLAQMHDLFDKLPLIRNPYIKLTMQMHTATAVIPYTHATTVMGLTSVSSSFNYNPLMISKVTDGFVGTADCNITIKSGIGAVDNSNNFLGTDRTCYFNACLYEFNPEGEKKYIESVGNKVIKYQDVYSNRFVNCSGPINWQIHTGLSKIRGLLIVTNLGSGVNTLATPATAVGAGTSVLLSPFSSGENMLGCSYTNVNVKLGGLPYYVENLNYGYDVYKREILSYNSVNGGLTPGVNSGLISQNDWESGVFAYHFFDLSKKSATEDDIQKTIHFTAY